MIALSLATSGFSTVKEIAEAEIGLLRTVPGLDEEDLAQKVRLTAETYVSEHGDEPGVLSVVDLEAKVEEAAGEEAIQEEEGKVEESVETEQTGKKEDDALHQPGLSGTDLPGEEEGDGGPSAAETSGVV